MEPVDRGLQALVEEISTNSVGVTRVTLVSAKLAQRRGSETIEPDDLLLATLQEIGHNGYAILGRSAFDLEVCQAFHLRDAPAGAPYLKPGLSEETARFLERAAHHTKLAGRSRVELIDYLLAFADVPCALFQHLMAFYHFTPDQFREEIQRLAELPAEAAGTASISPPAEATRPEPAEEQDLLSPEQAARYLGVHIRTVRMYITMGKLQAYRLAGQRVLRIKREALRALLEPVSPEAAFTREQAHSPEKKAPDALAM